MDGLLAIVTKFHCLYPDLMNLKCGGHTAWSATRLELTDVQPTDRKMIYFNDTIVWFDVTFVVIVTQRRKLGIIAFYV